MVLVLIFVVFFRTVSKALDNRPYSINVFFIKLDCIRYDKCPEVNPRRRVRDVREHSRDLIESQAFCITLKG